MAQRWIKSTTTKLLVAVVLLLLGLGILPLLGQRWIYLLSRDVDIRSGVLRRRVYVLTLPFSEKTQDSALSREVRRLGIVTPSTPAWKHTYEGRLIGRTHVDYAHGRVVAMGAQLLTILELAKAPDDERRDVLERFMAALQSGDSQRAEDEAFVLMDEVGQRHGMEVFVPEVKPYIRALRGAQKPPQPGSTP